MPPERTASRRIDGNGDTEGSEVHGAVVDDGSSLEIAHFTDLVDTSNLESGRVRRIDRVEIDVALTGVVMGVIEPIARVRVRVEWNGPAYNERTNMLYVPAVDWCTTFHLAEEVRFIPGKGYLGGYVAMEGFGKGRLTAVDGSDGTIRWRYDSPRPMVGAVTTTAGGLVLTGEFTGDFLILDAASGEELYRFNVGGPIGGGVVTYEANGKQYIAVMSGRPSAFWAAAHSGAPIAFVFAIPEPTE